MECYYGFDIQVRHQVIWRNVGWACSKDDVPAAIETVKRNTVKNMSNRRLVPRLPRIRAVPSKPWEPYDPATA